MKLITEVSILPNHYTSKSREVVLQLLQNLGFGEVISVRIGPTVDVSFESKDSTQAKLLTNEIARRLNEKNVALEFSVSYKLRKDDPTDTDTKSSADTDTYTDSE